jgi:iron complex outermembrane receptor protein
MRHELCVSQNSSMYSFAKFAISQKRFVTLSLYVDVGLRLALVVLFLSLPYPCSAAQQASQLADLKQLSLEQLMNVEVTSVAKKEQRVADTAAAIFVITQEDIRRSGVTSIPEALRLAPGVEVSRIDANKWSIGVRGFGSRLSRSVLVLMDGRSVYSPLFAGVYWEVQDTLLEDVDRIEVIRGPGGTLWGANAVNGVINIITKSATETQGLLVTGGGGSEEKGFGGLRYGGKIGEDFSYRLYGKGFRRDGQFTAHASDFDDWQNGQGGFRTDWNLNKDDSLTIQGDAYQGKSGQRTTVSSFSAPFSAVVRDDTDFSGMNLLGRWRRTLSETSNLAFQVYYDRTFRREPTFQERRNTVDLDFQHRFKITGHQELTWGLGYRFTRGDTESAPTIVFSPRNRADNLASAFLQDEIVLVENTLRLTVGSKFEHNDYSGFEFQPSARLLWTPAERHYLWAAISRAVRTPSRVEEDLALTAALSTVVPIFARLSGNKSFEAEKVMAYEVGYRVQPTDRFSVDIAAFYSRYSDLLSLENGVAFLEPPGNLILPFSIDNKMTAQIYGFEVATDWRWLDWWRWRLSYSHLQLNLKKKPGSSDSTTERSTEGSSPHNQLSLISFVDLPGGLQLDGIFRYVDSLPSQNVGRYFNLDLRLGWHATKNVELSLVGQNLLYGHHAEWSGGTEIQRGVYTKVTWRW